MILGARIINERVDSSQSVAMNFIVNHALNGVTEHLHCNSSFHDKDIEITYLLEAQIVSLKMETHRIDFVYEHAEIIGLWIIATQIWMTGFHAVIIGLFNLRRCGIWKLITRSNQLLDISKQILGTLH